MLKECLKYDIVPFILSDDVKMYYYRGLQELYNKPAFLLDICFIIQDRFEEYFDCSWVEYE